MAQTKKRRRSKHRGNAAGMVEARGRTGRKLSPAEQKQLGAKQTRQDRMFREPTWKGAAYRSAFAAIVFGLLVTLLMGQTVARGISLTVFVFLLYIPLGYYVDAALYRRAQRKRLAAAKHKA